MLTSVYFQGCASCESYFYQVIFAALLIYTFHRTADHNPRQYKPPTLNFQAA